MTPARSPGALAYGEDYFASTYRNYWRQNPRRKLDWYLNQVREHLPAGPIEHLDIGCGLGSILEVSAERGYRTFGTDISPYAVAETRRRVPKATLDVCPAEDQPFPSDSFDLISVLDVLEHLEDPRRSLLEVQRLLRVGGVALLVVPVYDGMSGPVVRWLDRDPTHVHRLGRREWLTIVDEAFDLLRWVGVVRFLASVGPYLHLPTESMRNHAPAIAMIARKRSR